MKAPVAAHSAQSFLLCPTPDAWVAWASENPRILRRQAEFWLSCEDWDSPFSFNNVCEALALDPTALRERILQESPAAR